MWAFFIANYPYFILVAVIASCIFCGLFVWVKWKAEKAGRAVEAAKRESAGQAAQIDLGKKDNAINKIVEQKVAERQTETIRKVTKSPTEAEVAAAIERSKK